GLARDETQLKPFSDLDEPSPRERTGVPSPLVWPRLCVMPETSIKQHLLSNLPSRLTCILIASRKPKDVRLGGSLDFAANGRGDHEDLRIRDNHRCLGARAGRGRGQCA